MPSSLTGFVKNDCRLDFDEATHTYRLGDRVLSSVTQVLAETGLAQFDQPWFSDAVKARGTFLHEAIALDIEGDLDDDTLDEQLRGGIEGWRAFMRDTNAKIEFTEQMLCDPDQGVAGRLDLIVILPGPNGRQVRTLIDIKRALYPCAAIQLAAYVDMATALYDHAVFFQRAALVLPGDGTYQLHHFTDHLDRATWQAAVRILNWRKQHAAA